MTPEEINELRLNIQKQIEDELQNLVNEKPEINSSLADKIRGVMQQHPWRQYEEMTPGDEAALLNNGILTVRYREFVPDHIAIVCTRNPDGSIEST